jgi:tetratricopeptide (TPR) repeat protein
VQIGSTSADLNKLFYAGRLQELIERCAQTVHSLRSELGESHPEVAPALERLGQSYFEAGDYPAAITAVDAARRIYLSSFGRNDQHYVRCLCNLARVHLLIDQDEHASRLLFEARTVLPSLTVNEASEVARTMLLSNLAHLYGKRKEFDTAESCLVEAIRRNVRLFGKQHPNTALLFHHLSALYARQGRHVAAEKSSRKAIDISRSCGQLETPDAANFHVHLSRVLAKQDRLREARDTCRQGIEILHQVRPASHADLTNAKQVLAEIETRMERSEHG